MKKFIYDPSQYNNFHIEVRKKILNSLLLEEQINETTSEEILESEDAE